MTSTSQRPVCFTETSGSQAIGTGATGEEAKVPLVKKSSLVKTTLELRDLGKNGWCVKHPRIDFQAIPGAMMRNI